MDFVVACEGSKLRPYLLEINSEPAIELTGHRLKWILEDLFRGIAKLVVEPHIRDWGEKSEEGDVQEGDGHFLRCLEIEVRGKRAW